MQCDTDRADALSQLASHEQVVYSAVQTRKHSENDNSLAGPMSQRTLKSHSAQSALCVFIGPTPFGCISQNEKRLHHYLSHMISLLYVCMYIYMYVCMYV